jgi:hypothetical protein
MHQTITRLFDNRTDAETAVRDLEKHGVHKRDISILAQTRAAGEPRSFSDHPIIHERHTEAGPGAGLGATAGGLIGAGAGLLAGLGMIVIPGIGPILAAGWIATTAAGLVAGGVAGGVVGGLVGALVDAGVSEEDAHVYAEGVRRGGSLVVARVKHQDAAKVEEILERERGVEASARREDYRREGWTRFDAEHTPPETVMEHQPADSIADVSDVPVAAEDGAALHSAAEDPVLREARAARAEEAAREDRSDAVDRIDPA